MIPIERSETLAMIWPGGKPHASHIEVPPGYALRTEVDRVAFEQVQMSIGFEVTETVWNELIDSLVADSMVFAETNRMRDPVAVAAGQRRTNGLVELGWVAVAPAHRGRGLGLAVCSLLTRRLQTAGETRLFGSTQDHRLAALRIYFALGFHPVFRPEKIERWRSVCEHLRVPFTPTEWGWPMHEDHGSS